MSRRYIKAERAASIEHLRELLKPGDTVWGTMRSVARSGMSRWIDFYYIEDNEPRWITYHVARALDEPFRGNKGMRVTGCGMDMVFHSVYSLSRTLFPPGTFKCIGKEKRCPSNDHTNDRGREDYSPDRVHSDGGYALRKRDL